MINLHLTKITKLLDLENLELYGNYQVRSHQSFPDSLYVCIIRKYQELIWDYFWVEKIIDTKAMYIRRGISHFTKWILLNELPPLKPNLYTHVVDTGRKRTLFYLKWANWMSHISRMLY